MKKILFVCNFASPYRVQFWNELTKYCDVTVLFSEKTSQQKGRNEKWFADNTFNFHNVFLKQFRIGKNKHICLEVTKYLKQKYDIIVFHPYSPLTCVYGIFYCILHHIPYIINSDGGFAKNGKGLQERLKTFLISHAESWLSTGQKTDEYLQYYGAIPEKIYRYHFTTLLKKDIRTDIASEEEKNEIRKALGIKGERVAVTVGQTIPRKGLDVLLKAIAVGNIEACFYIIGGEPTEELKKIIEDNKLKNVFFISFLEKEKLLQYYSAADLFVLPTREDIWGLVINEAMSRGLPVITTERCIAGSELVKDGENGYIVPVENIKELSNKIGEILSEPKEIGIFGRKSLKTISEYTIENMAKEHDNIFEIVLSRR